MQFKLLTAALLSAVALAEPALQERQVSYPPAISTYISEVNVLVSSYLLNPAASNVFVSAIAAASITDYSALITGTAFPTAILSALPSAYQPNFVSFISVVSSLRQNAYSAAGLLSTITGSNSQSTSTAAVPSTSTGAGSSSGSATTTGGAAAGGSGSGSSSATGTSSVSLTTTTSQTILTSISTGASTTSTVLSTRASTIVSTVSKAHAMPTSVVNVAAGLVGLLGVAIAL